MTAVTFSLAASRSDWTDSGLVLTAGDGLHVSANGDVQFADDPDVLRAYPEGAYSVAETATYAPGLVLQIPNELEDPGEAVCSNVVPYCLALDLRPEGEGAPPADGEGVVADALRGTRYVFYDADTLQALAYSRGYTDVGGLRVWVILNDVFGRFEDNDGQFQVTLLTRAGRETENIYSAVMLPETGWTPG